MKKPMQENLSKSHESGAQLDFYRFILVGIGSNLINFSIYLLLVSIGISVFMSSLSGYSAGLIFSFLLGKSWVFNAGSLPTGPAAIKFGIVYTVGGLGMSLIAETSYEISSLDYVACWFLGAVYAAINNYLGSKYFAFSKR